jgi:hypothetical protein
MSTPSAQPDEPFQPGQVGVRHLLGGMTVAGVVLAVSAARLRSLGPLQAGQVAAHWALLAVVAGGTFYFHSRRRRRNRAAAGELWLRVLRRPVTTTGRTVIALLLTACVVLDGIFVSLAAVPAKNFGELFLRIGPSMNSLFYLLFAESLLWGACLNHWLSNVYWVEFRENGLLTHSRYLPWNSIHRIAWSPAHPQNLVIMHNRLVEEMPINPASHDAVSELLDKFVARRQSSEFARRP